MTCGLLALFNAEFRRCQFLDYVHNGGGLEVLVDVLVALEGNGLTGKEPGVQQRRRSTLGGLFVFAKLRDTLPSLGG